MTTKGAKALQQASTARRCVDDLGRVVEGEAFDVHAKKHGLCDRCGETKTHLMVKRGPFQLKKEWMPITSKNPDGTYVVYNGYCLGPNCHRLCDVQEKLQEQKKKTKRYKKKKHVSPPRKTAPAPARHQMYEAFMDDDDEGTVITMNIDEAGTLTIDEAASTTEFGCMKSSKDSCSTSSSSGQASLNASLNRSLEEEYSPQLFRPVDDSLRMVLTQDPKFRGKQVTVHLDDSQLTEDDDDIYFDHEDSAETPPDDDDDSEDEEEDRHPPNKTNVVSPTSQDQSCGVHDEPEEAVVSPKDVATESFMHWRKGVFNSLRHLGKKRSPRHSVPASASSDAVDTVTTTSSPERSFPPIRPARPPPVPTENDDVDIRVNDEEEHHVVCTAAASAAPVAQLTSGEWSPPSSTSSGLRSAESLMQSRSAKGVDQWAVDEDDCAVPLASCYWSGVPSTSNYGSSVRSASYSPEEKALRHAQNAGVLWQTLVGQNVRFPTSWWNGARSPEMGVDNISTENCQKCPKYRWLYIGRERIYSNRLLSKMVPRRNSPGRLLLHIVVRNESCRATQDVAIGCYHTNALDEAYRVLWMAIRPRSGQGTQYVSRLNHLLTGGAKISDIARESPQGKGRPKVSQQHLRRVYGDEPPVETIFMLESKLVNTIKEVKHGSPSKDMMLLLLDLFLHN